MTGILAGCSSFKFRALLHFFFLDYTIMCSKYDDDLSPNSDFNECDTRNVTCHENAECFNTEGSYKCICRLGFTGDGLINCSGKIMTLVGFNSVQA